MRVEVMQHYELTPPLSQAGYFETELHKQLLKDIKGAIQEGRLIAVGSGKTVTMRRLQQQLKEENKITVSKSLAIEKHSVKLVTLISALFYDLSTDKKVQIPKGKELERALRDLVRKKKRPVALFVDEAHDLNSHTLTGLKRLMEEIGFRTDVFNLDGLAGNQREYIHWLISSCTKSDIEVESILATDAIDLLATRLRTLLQIQLHLTLSLEASYQTSGTPGQYRAI